MHAKMAVRNTDELQWALSPAQKIEVDLRCSAIEQMLVTTHGHPFCTGQVAFPCTLSALKLLRRIDVQDDFGHVLPVGSSLFRIEQTQICDQVQLVVFGQRVIDRRGIVNGRVKLRALHQHYLESEAGMIDASIVTINPALASTGRPLFRSKSFIQKHDPMALRGFDKENSCRFKRPANLIFRALMDLEPTFGFQAFECGQGNQGLFREHFLFPVQ